MATAVAFDPFTLYEQADPYPLYRWLRDDSPVHYHEGADMWVVTRYDDCVEVLRDPTTFSSRLGMRRTFVGAWQRSGAEEASPFEDTEDLRVLISTDPPDHVRLRRLLSRPFTPREIGIHEDWMRPLCATRFEALMERNADGGADWVHDFTWPFPVLVIGELLGIPASMRSDFKRWSDALIGIFVGGVDLGDDRVASFLEMLGFFGETIAERRSVPGDDLISTLIHKTEADDDPLTANELVMFCVLLLVAGNETTTNLLSNAAKVLASDPTVLDRLRDEPELIPGVVEEVLRFDSPVQATLRGTTAPIQVGETAIPADQTVLVHAGAANRDDRHYDDPDRFDPRRNPTDHLGFGSGIHLCLGAPLARLEAAIALELLSHRVADIELTAPPVPTGGLLLRGSASMPVQLTER
jgi:cytochrome P450